MSYQRIEAELSFLDIKWKWPQRRLQEQRLEFFLVSIKKKEFTDIVIPKDGLKRNRGRPRFRMIDAIKDDLKDTEGIDFKRIVKVFRFHWKESMAFKVIAICENLIETRIEEKLILSVLTH